MTAVAWLLVLTFALVPAISRAQDRLSAADAHRGPSFSKNIERPYEKHGGTALVAVGARPQPPAWRVETLRPVHARGVFAHAVARRPLRGPPYRQE